MSAGMAASVTGIQSLAGIHFLSNRLHHIALSHNRSRILQSSSSRRKNGRLIQTRAASDASTTMFAKELERVAAKESLLLAIKDAGGFESLAFGGNETDSKVIDIYEKVLALERLNPTPRPTTSPLLEGLWRFEWAGARSPGILASQFVLKNFPSSLLSSKGLTLKITDGTAKATFDLKVFGSVELSYILTTSLSAEGPVRLRERYEDGVLAPPVIDEGQVPPQVQNIYNQALATVQRLPEPIRDNIINGIKINLGGSFERLLIISFLDEEVLIARDITGAPDILSRVELKTPVIVVPEYQS